MNKLSDLKTMALALRAVSGGNDANFDMILTEHCSW